MGEASLLYLSPVPAGWGGSLLKRAGRGSAGQQLSGYLGQPTWRGVSSALQSVTPSAFGAPAPTPTSSCVRPASLVSPPGLGLDSTWDLLHSSLSAAFVPNFSSSRSPTRSSRASHPTIPRPHTWSAAPGHHRLPDSRAGTSAAILDGGADGRGRASRGGAARYRRGLRWAAGAGGTQGLSAARSPLPTPQAWKTAARPDLPCSGRTLTQRRSACLACQRRPCNLVPHSSNVDPRWDTMLLTALAHFISTW